MTPDRRRSVYPLGRECPTAWGRILRSSSPSPGLNPPTWLERQGSVALTGALERRVPLADVMTDQHLATRPAGSDRVTRLVLVRDHRGPPAGCLATRQ